MNATASLETRLLALLSRAEYAPRKQHELAKLLNLNRRERARLRVALRAYQQQGKIVRLRKNRWALPDASRHAEARLSILPSGDGIASGIDDPGLEFFVPASALCGALHGDVVLLDLAGTQRRGRAAVERHAARVVRVISRNVHRLAGQLLRSRYYWYVLPLDPRFPQTVQVASFAEGLTPIEHRMVTVELEPWSRSREVLRGTVVEDLGDEDQAGMRERLLLKNYQLDPTFDPDIEAAVRRAPAQPGPADLAGREDARALLTFTIDPIDARDFDDAVSLREIAEGWELGVHIADVSHFVPIGSAVDREAARRGTSVYLTGGFIPMLPHYLTSEVCSLKPGVDRLTMTVWLRLKPDGVVFHSRIASTVIRSRARLDYDQVQQHIDDPARSTVPPDLRQPLRQMWELAARIRRRRMMHGALDLAMPEVNCALDSDGRVLGIRRRGAPEAYHLIEEFMLLANVAVAERLAQGERPALYRIHEEPRPEQWAKMRADLAALAIHKPINEKQDINRICQATESTAGYLVHLAILRNLNRALYSDRKREHFGLGFPCYTHFTSPIRRYPDLVVHRLLKAAQTRRQSPYTHSEMRRLAAHCSQAERNADEAEEASLRLKCLEYYAARMAEGETGPYPAVITGILSRGLLVELTESLQRALLPLHSLGREEYERRPELGWIRGRRSRTVYRIGQTLSVRLARIDQVLRRMDVALAEGERPAHRTGRGQRIK